MSIDDVLAEALRLSRRERARLAEELLASLEEPDDQVVKAWASELQRRSQQVASAEAQTIPWETVRQDIREEIEKRHEQPGKS